MQRGPNRRRALAASLTLVGAALLAACSSGGGATRSRSHPLLTTPSTAAPQPAPPCQASQLQASFGMLGAGAGQRYVILALTNAGAPCQMAGYVGLQLLGAGGVPIPTVVDRDTGALVPITLLSGAAASTQLHWAGIPLSDEAQSGPCEPQPAQVEITPPNQTQFVTTAWTLDPVCGHGHIDLPPLVRGVPAP